MGYYTGTFTTVTDLLQKVVTHLVAAGWTQNMSQAEGSGWRAHLNKGSFYVNFRAIQGETAGGISSGYCLAMNAGEFYNNAVSWYQQAGVPVQSGTSTPVGVAIPFVAAGPYNAPYFVMTDAADNVFIVVERAGGLVGHIGFGPSVSKVGTWTGGQWIVGTTGWTYATSNAASVEGVTTTSGCPGCYGNYIGTANGYVKADVDGFTGKWISIGSAATTTYGWTGKRCFTPVKGLNDPDTQIPGYGTNWQGRQTSDMTGRANRLPVHLWVERDAGAGGGVSLIGELPGVRFTNGVGKGYSSGQEVSDGVDNWKFFPNFAIRKVA